MRKNRYECSLESASEFAGHTTRQEKRSSQVLKLPFTLSLLSRLSPHSFLLFSFLPPPPSPLLFFLFFPRLFLFFSTGKHINSRATSERKINNNNKKTKSLQKCPPEQLESSTQENESRETTTSKLDQLVHCVECYLIFLAKFIYLTVVSSSELQSETRQG